MYPQYNQFDYNSFFLINKKIYIEENYLMQKNTRQREKQKGKRKEKILNTQERAKEDRERITRGESPSPRPVKQRTTEKSQKLVIRTLHVLLFRSLQRHHIKHKGAKFQMLDKCFPGQFYQPNRVSATDLGKTQENPKDLNTKLHNR